MTEPEDAPTKPPIRLSFVCAANICRSPMAEAIMRQLVKEAGLEASVVVESAGVGDWHVGEPRHPDSREVCRRRGLPLEGAARQFQAADFERFDYVLAMDHSNRDRLLELAPDAAACAKVCMLRSFDPAALPGDAEIADPYSSGNQEPPPAPCPPPPIDGAPRL